MGSCDNDNDAADDAENDNDNDNDKYRILHGRVGIRILSSRAENISLSLQVLLTGMWNLKDIQNWLF